MSSEKKVLESIDAYMDDLIDGIFSRSQLNLVKNGSVDSGQLLKSGNVNRKFLEKEIVYAAPHAVWTEYGTHPHSVSEAGRKNIQKWASRKLGLGEKEAVSASWAIAQKIKNEGTQAKPFLRPALDEVMVKGV